MDNKNWSGIEGATQNLDKVADIQKKRLELIGHVVRKIREGQLKIYLRLNQSKVQEGEDLEWDGWKMKRKIYRTGS